jgi:hypothetical protein
LGKTQHGPFFVPRAELVKEDPVEVFASYWLAAVCKLHKDREYFSNPHFMAEKYRTKLGIFRQTMLPKGKSTIKYRCWSKQLVQWSSHEQPLPTQDHFGYPPAKET